MTRDWQTICSDRELVPYAGIAALIDGEQVAVFYLPGQDPELYALGNHDPIGQANVLARGIVGDIQGELVVASPLYKQHFSLTTGVCLEREDMSVPVWQARLEGGDVLVRPARNQPPVLQRRAG